MRASVVIPVHGRAQLTGRCLEAVLGDPARRPDELIVVDDASTDSTVELLAAYGDAIRVLRLQRNTGFATAANRGAAAASGEAIVFLNNDTEPQRGWLEALLAAARAHPGAAAIGARLLYPTGAVQHAGVAIGQDGYPHNLYAGFPAEHPAVLRSRSLQAVTGACMLVRRDAFEAVGGFDEGYLNSLEDVDLCLRLGAAGGEVRYCAEAVVTHLESASRGRSDRFEQSLALWRERWRGRVRRDDLALYVEDGLIEAEYADAYPLRLELAAELAIVGERERPLERLLESYARRLSDLSAEVVRLTVALGSRPPAPPSVGETAATALDHDAFLREATAVEAAVAAMQRRLEGGGVADGSDEPFAASASLGYRAMSEELRRAVIESVPVGARVLVVSRGDRELLELEGREGLHFPQGPDGDYAGHHPGDGEEAVAQLESLREAGATHLVLPASARWWLEHYGELAAHLGGCERHEDPACTIYELTPVGDGVGAVAGDER
jgi:GT2 family glycosyltransferase